MVRQFRKQQTSFPFKSQLRQQQKALGLSQRQANQIIESATRAQSSPDSSSSTPLVAPNSGIENLRKKRLSILDNVKKLNEEDRRIQEELIPQAKRIFETTGNKGPLRRLFNKADSLIAQRNRLLRDQTDLNRKIKKQSGIPTRSFLQRASKQAKERFLARQPDTKASLAKQLASFTSTQKRINKEIAASKRYGRRGEERSQQFTPTQAAKINKIIDGINRRTSKLILERKFNEARELIAQEKQKQAENIAKNNRTGLERLSDYINALDKKAAQQDIKAQARIAQGRAGRKELISILPKYLRPTATGLDIIIRSGEILFMTSKGLTTDYGKALAQAGLKGSFLSAAFVENIKQGQLKKFIKELTKGEAAEEAVSQIALYKRNKQTGKITFNPTAAGNVAAAAILAGLGGRIAKIKKGKAPKSGTKAAKKLKNQVIIEENSISIVKPSGKIVRISKSKLPNKTIKQIESKLKSYKKSLSRGVKTRQERKTPRGAKKQLDLERIESQIKAVKSSKKSESIQLKKLKDYGFKNKREANNFLSLSKKARLGDKKAIKKLEDIERIIRQNQVIKLQKLSKTRSKAGKKGVKTKRKIKKFTKKELSRRAKKGVKTKIKNKAAKTPRGAKKQLDLERIESQQKLIRKAKTNAKAEIKRLKEAGFKNKAELKKYEKLAEKARLGDKKAIKKLEDIERIIRQNQVIKLQKLSKTKNKLQKKKLKTKQKDKIKAFQELLRNSKKQVIIKKKSIKKVKKRASETRKTGKKQKISKRRASSQIETRSGAGIVIQKIKKKKGLVGAKQQAKAKVKTKRAARKKLLDKSKSKVKQLQKSKSLTRAAISSSIRSKTKTSQRQKTPPRQKTLPRAKTREKQEQISIQDTRSIQRQNAQQAQRSIQDQDTRQRTSNISSSINQSRTIKKSSSRGKSKPPRSPRALPPPLKAKKKKKTAEKNKGFIPEVRFKGKFVKLTKEPLPKNKAIKAAKTVVDNTSTATFRLKTSKKKIAGKDIKRPSLAKFRKSKKNSTYLVEKNKYRIDTSGEKKQITLKGLRLLASKASKGGKNVIRYKKKITRRQSKKSRNSAKKKTRKSKGGRQKRRRITKNTQ